MPSSNSCTGSYASSPPKSLEDFWPKQQAKIDKMTMTNFREVNRHSELPIARIKKIMKIEEGVKSQMISAEAPVLLAKAAELFIEELTLRSWLHTNGSRRKTIQKGDVTGGAARSEMFDFLIDILPRDESASAGTSGHQQSEEPNEPMEGENGDTDGNQQQQIQYILQYTDGSVPCLAADSVLSVDNGNVLQATQIGQPIPLSTATSGQPILMTIPGGERQQQFQIVHNQHPQMNSSATEQQRKDQRP